MALRGAVEVRVMEDLKGPWVAVYGYFYRPRAHRSMVQEYHGNRKGGDVVWALTWHDGDVLAIYTTKGTFTEFWFIH